MQDAQAAHPARTPTVYALPDHAHVALIQLRDHLNLMAKLTKSVLRRVRTMHGCGRMRWHGGSRGCRRISMGSWGRRIGRMRWLRRPRLPVSAKIEVLHGVRRGRLSMPEYQFNLRFMLSADDEDPERHLDALAEQGCTDACVGVGCPGFIALDFIREASTPMAAVESALNDATRAMPGARLLAISPLAKSNIFAVVHETMAGLHQIGLADARTMRKFDAMCLIDVASLRSDAKLEC